MKSKRRKDFSGLPSILIKRKTRKSAMKKQTPSSGEKVYAITPVELLAVALDSFVKKYNDNPPSTAEQYVDYINEFQVYLIDNLAKLLGCNEVDKVLGHDFNEFIGLFVTVMNRAGKFRKIIMDNGLGHLIDEDDKLA